MSRDWEKEDGITYLGVQKKKEGVSVMEHYLHESKIIPNVPGPEVDEYGTRIEGLVIRRLVGSEMPGDVINGIVDSAIVGSDRCQESQLDLKNPKTGATVMAELQTSRASHNPAAMVVYTRKDSGLVRLPTIEETVQQLANLQGTTEYPVNATELLCQYGLKPSQIKPFLISGGMTEVKVKRKQAPYGVDVRETGGSIRRANLVEIAELSRSFLLLLINNIEAQWEVHRRRNERVARALLSQIELKRVPKVEMLINVPTSIVKEAVRLMKERGANRPNVLPTDDPHIKSIIATVSEEIADDLADELIVMGSDEANIKKVSKNLNKQLRELLYPHGRLWEQI